jgi:hypothetical protein
MNAADRVQQARHTQRRGILALNVDTTDDVDGPRGWTSQNGPDLRAILQLL